MDKRAILTSNTEETVTISRAEYEFLRTKHEALTAEYEALRAERETLSAENEALKRNEEVFKQNEIAAAQEIASLTLKNQWLMEQLTLSKKKIFGQSSEQMDQLVMEQFSLTMNEAEALDADSLVQEKAKTKVKSHTRKPRSGSIEDVIPEGLPVETIEHHPDDIHCPSCGTEMTIIGKEVHRSLKIIPPQYSVVEDVYFTYACKDCEKRTDEAVIVKASKEPTVLPHSFASPEAIAYLMEQKYVMYSPLYRLEQEMNRAGLKLSRQTMSNWLLRASDTWLKPVYDKLREELLKHKVLHGDETTLQVLKEPGKTAASKSYMWLYRTGGDAEHPIVLYEYKPDRKAANAEAFLKDFHGWLHADGYQGYHRLPSEIRVVGCWAHARRKFDEALNVLPKEERAKSQAAVGVCYCSKLFRLEDEFAGLTPEERHRKRLEQAKPVLDAMLAWADSLLPKTAGKSALGKALHYLKGQWPYLVRYLEDGRLEISNNRAERSIKPFVMGRKNWLFANTPGGAKSSSVIYSLIETAKENGLDPYRYLLWLLREAPKLAESSKSWAEDFLPESAPDACRSK